MSEFDNELAEAETLLSTATFPGVKSVLQAHVIKLKKAESDRLQREAAKEEAAKVASQPAVERKPIVSVKGSYIPIENFAWDQGEYNSSTLSIFIDLDGVSAAKDRVEADFTATSFDVKVTDLNGKNYRLVKDNLEKNIVPDKCKCIVKNNKIVLKLQKVKGEYSFDHWTSLTSKKKKGEEVGGAGAKKDKDPMGGEKASLLH